MNILIPDSWLREHLKTQATPKKIAEYLSLCSQSVEKISKVGDDWVYEIEITTNRPDCLSVYGIARELAAVLPRFGIPARLQLLHPTPYTLHSVNKKGLPLSVKITKPSLCPRFTALIFDNITLKPSPKVIQERLEKSGIRALNNVVDISNYLMLELGQPMHTFDYDKIKEAKMILRESAGGEKITTLDGKIRPLPDGTIIIEDGQGRIIDLCGIMGGANSEVDENTQRVLLFVQTYNPAKVRQTCQKLGFRTEAASRFEKGVDPEEVITAIEKAVIMFKKNCGARIASKLIDIYPHPPKAKTIELDVGLVKKIIGIEIPKKEIVKILRSLGFYILHSTFYILHCRVPHWRYGDISIPEDLIEEVARIYGYYHFPSFLPTSEILLQEENKIFYWEEQIKTALKFWGFTEIFNYSMISELSLIKFGINPAECLKIANPLNEDLVYLRPSLIPSILETISQNKEFTKIIIFELANIYLPIAEGKLPAETPMLCGAIVGQGFYQAKGIIEALLFELGIDNLRFEPYLLRKTFYGKIFHPFRTAEIMLRGNSLGIIGQVSNEKIVISSEARNKVIFIFDLDLRELIKHIVATRKYVPISKYPAIVEDLAFIVPPKTLVGNLVQLIKSTSLTIQNIKLFDSYKNVRTFRIVYQDFRKTLTDKEIEKIRQEIIKKVESKFGAKLKSS